MFDLITGILEAVSGYLSGRVSANKTTGHMTMIIVSLAVGVMFFVAFGIYELIFPAMNPVGDVWLGLLGFSFALSFMIYVLQLAHCLTKKKEKHNKNLNP